MCGSVVVVNISKATHGVTVGVFTGEMGDATVAVGVTGETVGAGVPSHPMTTEITIAAMHNTRRKRWNLSRSGELIKYISPQHAQAHDRHAVLRRDERIHCGDECRGVFARAHTVP